MASNSVIQVAIIDTNDINIKKDLIHDNIEKLKHICSPFVKTDSIDSDILMDHVVEQIELKEELLGDTLTIFETDKLIYQLIHVEYDNDTVKIHNPKKNIIASYLTNQNIYGRAIVLSSKIVENHTCVLDSISIDELFNILYGKLIHTGIFIDSINGKCTQFDFLEHPVEYLESDPLNYDNYEQAEVFLFGMIVAIFYSKVANNENVNKKATCLLGNRKIMGNVVVFAKSDHEFQNINLELFKNLYKLSRCPLAEREVTGTENKNKKINDLRVIYNFNHCINNKLNNYHTQCQYCKQNIDQYLLCKGCYRVVYESEKCQKDDWNNHKKECLYNTIAVNVKKE